MEILIFSSNKSKIEEVLQRIKSKAKISKKGKNTTTILLAVLTLKLPLFIKI